MNKHEITLQRLSQRRSNQAIVLRQISEITNHGLAAGRKRTWNIVVPGVVPPVEIDGGGWAYNVRLELEYVGKITDKAVHMAQLVAIKDCMAKAGITRGNWTVIGHQTTQQPVSAFNGLDIIAEIEVDKSSYFDNIYGLDAQIEILLSALRIAKDTDFTKRYHAVLHGKPGCGKSELLSCVKEMVGEDGVIEFDGTQTTAAGAVAKIVDAEVLPPVLIIEEIEKVPDAAFMWLLGALDGRAEIKKVTARFTSQRKVPFVCFATVNDLGLFRSRHEGAMASRFAHNIYCPYPSEEVIRKILTREVLSIGGNLEWIEPALQYCIKFEKVSDPRRIIAVCLTGRDKLLDGSFQSALLACKEPS